MVPVSVTILILISIIVIPLGLVGFVMLWGDRFDWGENTEGPLW